MMLRRSITCLLAVGAVSALLTLSPPAAHAIPVAGDYVFTSGLTGTFTSDGTQLTAWDFLSTLRPTVQWQNGIGQTLDINETWGFGAREFAPHGIEQITILWNDNFLRSSFYPIGTTTLHYDGSVSYEAVSSASVPEPSALLLQGLALGVLAFIGYLRRQRQQAGLQVG